MRPALPLLAAALALTAQAANTPAPAGRIVLGGAEMRAKTRAGGRRASSTRGGRALQSSSTLSDTSILKIAVPGGGPEMTLPHTEALFGVPAYGGSRVGFLYYPTDVGANTGCSANFTVPASSIVLLDRGGGCSFTKKVYNAQQAGAVGVVVVDDLLLCGVDAACGAAACGQCPYYESTPTCQCFMRTMDDDGTGSLVNIPSFLVSNKNGTALKAYASGSPATAARATMQWDVLNPAGQVELQLWQHSNDAVAYSFRKSFEPYLPYLGSKLAFTPRYYIWDGRAMGCSAAGEPCGNQCLPGGWYCSIDPDGDLNSGASGADVVSENLRQLCIWQQVSANNGGALWWSYADAFVENCVPSAGTFDQACSEEQQEALGIDVMAVRACVTASSPTQPLPSMKYNKLLEVELLDRDDLDIVTLPTAVIQGQLLRGGLSTANILAAACATYTAGSAPAVCNCQYVPLDSLAACVNGGGAGAGGSSSGMPGWGVAIIVLVVLASIAGAGTAFWYNRRTRRDVAELLDDYRALLDDAAGAGGVDSDRARLRPKSSLGGRVADRINQLTASVLRAPVPGGAGGALPATSAGSAPRGSGKVGNPIAVDFEGDESTSLAGRM